MTISRIGIGIVDDDVRTSRRSVWVVSLAPGLSHFGWAVSIYSYTSLQRLTARGRAPRSGGLGSAALVRGIRRL